MHPTVSHMPLQNNPEESSEPTAGSITFRQKLEIMLRPQHPSRRMVAFSSIVVNAESMVNLSRSYCFFRSAIFGPAGSPGLNLDNTLVS